MVNGFTVKTESYVELPEGSSQDEAEAIVKAALEFADEVFLVKVERDAILVSR